MARRSTKLLRFENSLYNFDKVNSAWKIPTVETSVKERDLFDSGTHSTCKRMSQKVSPISLRKGYLTTWDSLFIQSYKSISIDTKNDLFTQDLSIRSYLESVFKNLKLYINKIQIKADKITDCIYIKIYLYEPVILHKKDILIHPIRKRMFKKSISSLNNDENTDDIIQNPFFKSQGVVGKSKWSLKISDLVLHLENFLTQFLFKKVKIAIFIEYFLNKSASLLVQFLVSEVEKSNGNFKRALKETFKVIKNKSNIKGIRINCSGRLGRAPMAKTEWFKFGQIPLNKINSVVDYSSGTAFTKYGSIGIKVWVYYYDS
jgi:small subunit ribosomal protein S3